ncbi:16S rRNA (cytosine(967)-C(5))-methyltransferase RsmB [Hutsoniella sourekii]|uniref:16S rRNA (cytosine(967)-C(5))-methyltransferase RsmB n=1 Tax=Hutsoniella sourekii TaxID=87650 RepID=UPI0004B01497|nr:16S rRNA (cytosine(967)-C(5))-methyltransferase RsmB [Hutsoniella sourekii]
MKIKSRAKNYFNENARFQALNILYQIEYQEGYSNVLINESLKNSQLNSADQRLMTQLVYGCLQRKLTLNYYFELLTKGKKTDRWVQTLIEMSLYQLIFLDRVPDHAVINEAVEIGKINGHQGLAKFINAILRKFQRDWLPVDLGKIDKEEIRYSIPQWIIDELESVYPGSDIDKLLKSFNEKAYVSARINPEKKMSQSAVIQALKEEGYQVEPGVLSNEAVRSLKGNLADSQVFKKGLITIQDESSMLVAPLGRLAGDEHVLDPCAAPGGKATHIAGLLDRGQVTAIDVSAEKINKLDENRKRLGLEDRLHLKLADARKFKPDSSSLYDRIYLDAPCSGLGLLRRKPEIRYSQTPQSVAALQVIQEQIIENVEQYLKVGGILIYSTCTLTRGENEEAIERFLKKYSNYSVLAITPDEVRNPELITSDGFIRVWPNQFQTDGFFIARIIKNS